MQYQITHLDNKVITRLIHGKYLKYYQINADQHKGNEVQTGRPNFKIIAIEQILDDRNHEGWVRIAIEYDPNFFGHLVTIFENIGYRSGYNDARAIYDIKPKTNKSNEPAY